MVEETEEEEDEEDGLEYVTDTPSGGSYDSSKHWGSFSAFSSSYLFTNSGGFRS